ncbi:MULTISPECIES: EAL domain-containing protein [unclassified Treponema]|uniref:EAL domain-containing protein n=1 Tax=unclassified Treponema TaxID=2638727 RepID=UPI0025CC6DFE|nr:MULTISPECIES: EAL domain-containing protein [unclassified Treponema]
MKTVYMTLSSIFIVLIGVYCVYLKQNKSPLSKSLFNLHCGVIASTVFYNISLLTTTLWFAYFIISLYHISIHFLIVLLADFIFIFTEMPSSQKHKKFITVFKKIWLYVFLVDAFILIINPFFHHEFELSDLYINHNIFLCWTAKYFFVFYIHLCLCILLSAVIFAILLKKIIQTNRFYKSKYILVFAVFLITFVVNIIFLKSKSYLDFSVLFYSIFSIICSYFTLFSIPRNIQNEMLKQLSDNINIGIFCFNLERKCIYSNNTAKKFFLAKNEILNELKSLLALRKDFVKRNIEIKQNNKTLTLSEEFSYLLDSQKKAYGYILKLSDITEELNKAAKELFDSTHDALTGLLTREAFYAETEKILKSNPDSPYYMICTNIKNFKLVNDLFGSEKGDEFLRKFAQALQKSQYKAVLTGRITGDRFAILMNKTEVDELNALQKIKELEKLTDSLNYKLHIFVGIYKITDNNEKVSSMFDKAVLAIKNISENYSANVAYYDNDLLSNLKKNRDVINAFNNALANKHLKMYLQPQVRCSDEKVVGAEALVRWETENGAIHSPNSFIKILEDNGLIHNLDKFIWEQAVQLLQKWQFLGIDYHISVNVSAKDFYLIDLYKTFTSLVIKYGIPPQKLKLEITETALVHDLKLHKQIITELQKFGFIIEMDDFGTGYSSLTILKNISINILKIDMMFLSKTKHEERSKKILEAVIKMAQKLGIKIIVEGVEDKEQAEFLKNLNCDFFQGYLYSKPISVADFESNYISKTNTLGGTK